MLCFEKGTASLTEPVSASDTAIHHRTNSIYLPLQHLEGATAAVAAATQDRLSSVRLTRACTNVHWETTIPLPIVWLPRRRAIQAKSNHSLMRGLTNRYCYSLWGPAAHTDRRLWRSCYQRRRSGYLHAYNGLEWNPTGGGGCHAY